MAGRARLRTEGTLIEPPFSGTMSAHLSPEQRKRFARHLALPGVGSEGQEKLLTSSVLVVGAGGLGSPLVMSLTGISIILATSSRVLGELLEVNDYILSCRVFGKYIEESMLIPIIDFALKNKLIIIFNFKSNGRNKYINDFLCSYTRKKYKLDSNDLNDLKNKFNKFF